MRLIILAAAVTTAVAIMRMRRGRRVTVRARVVYTKRPDPGRLAGRLVDAQLWGRLKSAFAVKPITADAAAILQDAEDPREIDVIESRRLHPAPTLDSHGFELRLAPSQVKDWGRTEENAATVRCEAEELVKTATGAAAVFAFDHTWRSSKRSNFDSSVGPGGRAANMSSAVARAHTDNTPTSAARKVDELVSRGLVPATVKDGAHRLAIFNVWRAYGVGATVRQYPLGCVKCRSVPTGDTFPYTLAHGAACGENGSVCFNSAHAWHYYDAMTPDEVLLLTNYEEPAASGGEVRVFHAALELVGQDCDPERVSVEVRVLALLPRQVNR